MPIVVIAADQGDKRSVTTKLPHGRTDKADRHANSAVGRLIVAVGVKQMAVVKRGLFQLKNDIDSIAIIHLNGNLLAARQQVMGVKAVHMRDLPDVMATRNEPHATIV